MPIPIRGIITLTTDFGESSYFAAVIKGVIANINPEVRVIDITHGVNHHDILEGAFILKCAYKYFPRRTVHMAVVDPGVGSERNPILVTTDNYYFIGPDNGIFSYIYEEEIVSSVYKITEEHYFLTPVCPTFHGRDLFAPVAAYFTKGVPINYFGEQVESYKRLPLPQPKMVGENVLQGRIIYIDRFGNLITDIRREHFDDIQFKAPGKKAMVRIANKNLGELQEYYAQAPPGRPAALIGSSNHLEIFVNQGQAGQLLGASKGEAVEVVIE